MDGPYPIEIEDYHGICPICSGEHDAIGACATCGYPVFRDCDGDVLHIDLSEVFERSCGPHLPTLAAR